MRLRPARPDEAPLLTDLCLASKAHWGYDAAFMALCRESLTVTPAMTLACSMVVAVDGDDRPRAIGSLAGEISPGEIEVALLFVHPQAMGQGLGRLIFEALEDLARSRGATRLSILADPGAVPFYLHMGAVQLGEAPSDAIPGRTLPLLSYVVGSRPRLPEDEP